MPDALVTALIIIVLILGGIGLLVYLCYIVARALRRYKGDAYKANLGMNLRFLQIMMPKNQAARQSDLDAKDHISSMKQNIEIMNQIYKNFYAITQKNFNTKHRGQPFISFELYAEKEVIKMVLGVPEDHIPAIEKVISSFYPGAVINRIDPPSFLEAGKYMSGGTFSFAKKWVYPIKTYDTFEADPFDSLLSSFSRVESSEVLALQFVISPVNEEVFKQSQKAVKGVKKGKRKPRYTQLFSAPKKPEDASSTNSDMSSQRSGALDAKVEDELFYVTIKALATSPVAARPSKILSDLSRSFGQYNYVGMNSITFSETKDVQTFVKNFIARNNVILQPRHKPDNTKSHLLLSIKELSSLIHFPHSRFNRNPRIRRQNYKIVAAPDFLPTEGLSLGYNLYGWVKKKVVMSPMDRFRHLYVIGQTGTGKSTVLLNLARQDVTLGNGFCMLDPHGDLCEDILNYFPKDRIDDLIYFDVANTEYPIAFNVFEAENDDEKDLVTNDIIEMFVSMYGEEVFGPRMQDFFRNAALLLMDQPEWGSMIEIMRLFTDPAFLEAKLMNLKNVVVRTRWEKTYKAMADRERQEMIPYLQAKFGGFTTGSYVRNIIGQPKSAFNFGEAMQQKKIILCNLSKGKVGEINSQLIGRMIAIQIKIAALRRASMEASERQPFFLYVDEFQNYVSQSFESILSEARKYRLGLVIAHQYIDQLKSSGMAGNIDLSKAIFGNVGSMMAMKVGPEDGEFLEKQFAPEFSAGDLVGLDKYKGIMTLSVDSQPTRPFSITPDNPYDPPINNQQKKEVIKQISALKRGTKRSLAEKEIFYRVGV